MTTDTKPLYKKFTVFRNDDSTWEWGNTVDGCFVLRPETDEWAKAALIAYSNAAMEDGAYELADSITDGLIRVTLGKPFYGE